MTFFACWRSRGEGRAPLLLKKFEIFPKGKISLCFFRFCKNVHFSIKMTIFHQKCDLLAKNPFLQNQITIPPLEFFVENARFFKKCPFSCAFHYMESVKKSEAFE
jgi:hypothetical protein